MSEPKDGDTSSSGSVLRELPVEKGDLYPTIDNGPSSEIIASDQEGEYPSGVKLALLIIALMLSMFLVGPSHSLLLATQQLSNSPILRLPCHDSSLC